MRNYLDKNVLLVALRKNNWNNTAVGRELGLSEAAIRRWKTKYGLVPDTKTFACNEAGHVDDNAYERLMSNCKPFVPVNVEPQIEINPTIVVPSGPDLRRVFVFSDIQGRDYNAVAFSIAIQRCTDYKPTHCVIIGDFMDNTALMGKDGKRSVALESEELADLKLEHVHCNKLLDMIDDALPAGCKKYFVKGNHEDRADKIVSKPNGDAWAEIILAEHVLKLKQRGWQWVQYNECVTLGKLKYTHGAFYDMHHAYHHARVYCENVVYGHTHQVQVFNMPTPARMLSFQAISVGCLSNVNPEWNRNKPNAHDHAFLEINYLPNGKFFPAVRRIIDGELLVGDKLYKG